MESQLMFFNVHGLQYVFAFLTVTIVLFLWEIKTGYREPCFPPDFLLEPIGIYFYVAITESVQDHITMETFSENKPLDVSGVPSLNHYLKKLLETPGWLNL